ncbi:MAG TPA: hypothetical protein DHV15_01620 [Treponema sp.]|uniref:Uncharacterized protein n=1 Tax=Treponema denticola (strain ATCC 35405 / DSM 14222 / CIP 103919 / JCM 8153 / KCTC 15104) TaxID=243275 RepID=Q73JX1_TREDE|nr:hypothetical protein TDE_2516 [Treponema denticola ATCC 35405]HCY94201.1 hypothetical protein [Treponema sp.]
MSAAAPLIVKAFAFLFLFVLNFIIGSSCQS